MESIIKGTVNFSTRLFSLPTVSKIKTFSSNIQKNIRSSWLTNNYEKPNFLLSKDVAKSQFSTCAKLEHFKVTEEFDYITSKHLQGARKGRINYKNPLGYGVNMVKAVVIRPVIKKPKKPNSANRKCVLVRIPKDGRELVAFIPGEGHNLQEHSIVMIQPGKLRDCPGVKVRCVRGCYDLPNVAKAS